MNQNVDHDRIHKGQRVSFQFTNSPGIRHRYMVDLSKLVSVVYPIVPATKQTVLADLWVDTS